MLNKFLASVGIGSASVDTVLDDDEVLPGGTLTGRVRVRGGSVEQRIDRITVQLVTRVAVEVNDRKVHQTQPFAEFQVSDGFAIAPGEAREIPFSIPVPLNAPITFPGTQHPVWLRTDLGIALAVDPSDNDLVQILPTPAQYRVVEAMERLGFNLRKVDVEHRRSWFGGPSFVQEFEFRPATRSRLRYDEIEIVFTPTLDGVELLLQVDRSARGLGGMLLEATGTDETWHRVRLSNSTLQAGTAAVAAAIEKAL